MKITKIKTKYGEFGSPVSTGLDAIVERMRSETIKSDAERIRNIALQSRLMMEKGAPRYLLKDADRLPYLLFSATFGKNGLDHPTAFSQLLLLTIPCPEGLRRISELKRLVAQVPYTLLAFAGVSGVTLKVLVRCEYSGGATPWKAGDCNHNSQLDTPRYLAFLKEAQETAARIYTALVQCDLVIGEPSLTRGCRMSYDPQLYYHPEAMALPVIHDDEGVLAPYEGTKADDSGTVFWFPDSDERERYKLEFYTCMKKALGESPQDMEHTLVLLAGYCQKAGLEEEACTVRAIWDYRFKPLGEDLIRKIFRETYIQPFNGKSLSQMNEKERIIRFIEDFFERRYQLRYNVVKQMTEYRPNDLSFSQWQPLTDRQLKSIVVEQMKEGGESWMNDIRIYIESAHVKDYNPVLEFLAGCGEWDGKRNYIEDFARRLPTDYPLWPKYFHRWFLAMVAQAMNINRDYGNSMVPMLIGGEGIKKSIFCKNILPPSMREYYMDDIKMQNAEQVERVLGRMWLVCIDEFNAKTPREQAKVKRLLTEKDVQMRKMRSAEYTMTPRLCSFIATTNDPTPLSSAEGNRRYLCVEVKGEIDMTERINYKQLYAQAVTELKDPDCLYWFTSEDERIIREHNQSFMEESSAEGVLPSLFEPVAEHTKENLWRVIDIQEELAKHLKSADVPTLKALAVSIKALRWPKGANNGARGYYLKLRESASL
ncbi:MAG: hypothetical protein IJQ60_03790 [Prevotella sp.]|nr:hypothetical protein [Prevotella sp.]